MLVSRRLSIVVVHLRSNYTAGFDVIQYRILAVYLWIVFT